MLVFGGGAGSTQNEGKFVSRARFQRRLPGSSTFGHPKSIVCFGGRVTRGKRWFRYAVGV